MVSLFRKVTSMVLCVALLIPSTVFASEVVNKGDIYFRGEKIEAYNAQFYQTSDDAIMIPIRAVSEALGYDVKWNDNKTVTVTDTANSFSCTFTPNSDEANGGISKFDLNYDIKLVDGTMYIDTTDFVIIYGVEMSYLIDDNAMYFEDAVYTGDEYPTEEQLQAQEEAVMELFSSEELKALVDFIVSSENFENLMTEMYNSQYFKPAMEELLYNEEFIQLVELIENNELYAAYVAEIETLDSYKKLCEETGYDNLMFKVSEMEVDEAINYMYKIYTAPSYMQFVEDAAKLPSYTAYVAYISTDEEFLGSVESVLYNLDPADFVNFEALLEEFIYSENLDKLLTEVSLSQEYADFEALVIKTVEEFEY